MRSGVLIITALIFGNPVIQEVPKVTKPVPVVQFKEEDSVVQESKVAKPVPVVTPAKEEEKAEKEPVRKSAMDDSLPVAAGEDVALLPNNFVKNKIDIMPMGAKGYVSVDAVRCDSRRRVYLDPDQIYGTPNEGRVLMISRTENGYHLTLDKVDHQWVCQELPAGVKWLVVKTITSK